MTAVNKKQIATTSGDSYKQAAAHLRAKVASSPTPLEREVRPEAGKIRAVLSGKPIARDRQESLFGQSAIDIPEFGQARNKSQ